ncbi:hypothetical protein LOTGIDRAFT_174281 [Lottia gigantea]|uniref:Fibronectin type-III domain-containing protein n=1 Tax=Lottia gigantea TaxID=225164 RepID=V4AU60_LOTGI|nr:hypothetical protein LOTGIDRAFT_174281 [Lottia gigantea]ESO98470.1 hypothetical protein LOTGIDRAFT_174281 [Lottia gigantea]
MSFVFTDNEVSAANVILTKPTVVCKYTPLLPDQDMIDRMLKYRRSSDVSDGLGDDNSSLVYLRWNVLGLNGVSTSIPLAFVVSLKSRYKIRESAWKTVAFTNFSFVPITGLSPSSEYNFRITVVGVEGIVDKAKDTDWTSIPEARAGVDAPKSISLIKQYYKGSSVHALMGWTPGKHGGCYFKLYWMKSNHGNYKTQDVKEWSKFEFEISDLDFNSEYIVEVETYDKDFLKSSKPSTKIKFRTLDCLNSTGHDYDICAPDQLSNITLEIGPKHIVDGQEVSDVEINWTLPQYISPSNDIEHIFLTWRKEPSIALSKYIIPHHGDRLLSKTAENVTLFGLHWNSVYAITTQVRSAGGISDKTINHAQLGSAYADINPEEITFEQTTSTVAEQLGMYPTLTN